MNQIEQLMALADEYALAEKEDYLYGHGRASHDRDALRAAIEQALKMEHLNYLGCMEDLKEAEKQPDHFRDATEKVDCPRCGHCCPDDTELRQLREQNTMLDAEAAKDEALLRQALEALERGNWYINQLEMVVYSSDDTGTHEERAKVQSAIAALRERLKS